MTTLYITEFSAMMVVGGYIGQVARQPAIAKQTVAIGGASAPSNPFNTATRFIRVHCDVICSVEIGGAPVAAATSERMAANQTEYFGVNPGDSIAVITNT